MDWSVMVHGGISWDGRTGFAVLNGTPTDQSYISWISDFQVRLFSRAVGFHFLYIDDNTRTYRVLMVLGYLQWESVEILYWIAWSSDH